MVDGADVRLNERADELIEDLHSLRRPRVVVISGPSGVGKDAVIQEMRARLPELHYAVTATTRERRPGEIDGVHYHFMEIDEFERLVEEREFLEHAVVYGNLYGVPKQRVRSALSSGQSVVIKVDVQGARTIREIIPQSTLIFIAPPSMSELLHRLRDRKSDDFEVVIRRLNTATQELTVAWEFDYLVFNETDRLSSTVEAISTIIHGEAFRIRQEEITL
ncbi:guanylate kinase [soil metagenome]